MARPIEPIVARAAQLPQPSQSSQRSHASLPSAEIVPKVVHQAYVSRPQSYGTYGDNPYLGLKNPQNYLMKYGTARPFASPVRATPDHAVQQDTVKRVAQAKVQPQPIPSYKPNQHYHAGGMSVTSRAVRQRVQPTYQSSVYFLPPVAYQ